MQSFGALQHFDYNVAGAYAYEQVMQTIRALGLGMSVVEEQYRRAVFNIVARNQDDHVKSERAPRMRVGPGGPPARAYSRNSCCANSFRYSRQLTQVCPPVVCL